VSSAARVLIVCERLSSKTVSASKPTVEKGDASNETRVKASGDTVVHVIRLEHH
jgi:hypothetical protein